MIQKYKAEALCNISHDKNPLLHKKNQNIQKSKVPYTYMEGKMHPVPTTLMMFRIILMFTLRFTTGKSCKIRECSKNVMWGQTQLLLLS